MKPADHPIHTRLPIGLEGQRKLQPVIEAHIGESIVDTSYLTSYCFDNMDFESPSFWIELKCRLEKYHWSDPVLQEGWLMPAVKIMRARCESKATRFYYFYKSDESLWYWDFNEADLKDCECKTPPWHRDYQPHYYIKPQFWKRV